MAPDPPHQRRAGAGTVLLRRADITTLDVDAIVNAANSQLAGGGGVDGAIHRAAGPRLMEEARSNYPQGHPTGEGVLTSAGGLKARHVIHTVGRVWRGGMLQESKLLSAAYRRTGELAVDND